jgi:hypothetical protein
MESDSEELFKILIKTWSLQRKLKRLSSALVKYTLILIKQEFNKAEMILLSLELNNYVHSPSDPLLQRYPNSRMLRLSGVKKNPKTRVLSTMLSPDFKIFSPH